MRYHEIQDQFSIRFVAILVVARLDPSVAPYFSAQLSLIAKRQETPACYCREEACLFPAVFLLHDSKKY
jgi:hypothetical protein